MIGAGFEYVGGPNGFWKDRIKIIVNRDLLHQRDMLEKTGCIDNFRIVAGIKEGTRLGLFYSDSDAYKWAEALSLAVYRYGAGDKLKAILEEFIGLIRGAMESDGYIFTYNQFYFPDTRWKYPAVEHELYCMGHLIEAGVTHYLVSGSDYFLNTVRKTADLIAEYASDILQHPGKTPGHQEIEIALARLYTVTGDKKYAEAAADFIKARGHIRLFPLYLIKNAAGSGKRWKYVRKYIKKKFGNPDYAMPPRVFVHKPRFLGARSAYLFGSGKYFQQHKPVDRQTVPEGHAVRFTYQQTAAAMLVAAGILPPEFGEALRKSWHHTVTRRMFVTGGIGAIPVTEAFGYDYELNPRYAYCETCASIGLVLWSHRMFEITGMPYYPELIEWCLFNLIPAGIANEGGAYYYRNPPASDNGYPRQEWYETPCCPPNIARTFLKIGGLTVYLMNGRNNRTEGLYISGFYGGKINFDTGGGDNQGYTLEIDSELPFDGKVSIKFTERDPDSDSGLPPIRSVGKNIPPLYIRIPGWTDPDTVKINGSTPKDGTAIPEADRGTEEQYATASGYSPYKARFICISEAPQIGDIFTVGFPMPVKIIYPHRKCGDIADTFSVARGPLLYAVEEIDNPFDIFREPVVDDPRSFVIAPAEEGLPKNTVVLIGQTAHGNECRMIPYFLIQNRKVCGYTVHLKKLKNKK